MGSHGRRRTGRGRLRVRRGIGRHHRSWEAVESALGIGPLRDRLDHSLDLLGEEGRPRHCRLRAVVDWSYGLLEPPETRLLAVLSVFGADFDLEAAEQVAGPVAIGSVAPALAPAPVVESSLGAARGQHIGRAN